MKTKNDFLEPWLSMALTSESTGKGINGRVLFNGKDRLVFPDGAAEWQKDQLTEAAQIVSSLATQSGPVWIISPHLRPKKAQKTNQKSKLKAEKSLSPSPFAVLRDAAGAVLQQAMKMGVTHLEIALAAKKEEAEALLVGLEIAQYRFKTSPKTTAPRISLKPKIDMKVVKSAELIGWCTNVARHLVNLPPNELTPGHFAQIAKSLAAGTPSVKVEVWDKEKLKKEKMNLLLAVGAAASSPPCLVHLRYRPSGKAQPIALVGKGITFDSGGLDIKTSSGMRLMKKDMGGAAAVLAAFLWNAKSKSRVPLDAYLSLAENAIGSNAFRPGDVYVARGGQSVEISNTDAEGRLVLADALDVAAEGKPAVVINLATLTGAIKVGLGAQLAGLFSNHTPLSERLHAEFWRAGDPTWIMPLFQKYRSSMATPFAEFVNSVEAPFGGAITAALFLETFVKETPWAHLDIYAWKDGSDGAWSESGGSGQGVVGLIHWLQSWTPSQI